jgi:hypothetical protein
MAIKRIGILPVAAMFRASTPQSKACRSEKDIEFLVSVVAGRRSRI